MIGGKREIVGAGSLVFIPKGAVHAFRVRSETARLLNLYSQAGFERIIALTGTKTKSRVIRRTTFNRRM